MTKPVLCLSCLLAVSFSNCLFAQFPVRGGSNYYFYEPVPAGVGNGYGLITDYYLQYQGTNVSSIIDSQLQTMAANGQARIDLPLFFADGASSTGNGNCLSTYGGGPGTSGVMESSGGSIPSACLSALISIIQNAYQYGFGVRLRFFPTGPNWPQSWTSGIQWTYAIHNLDFIQSVHDAMTSAGMWLDKYDLGNEGIVDTGSQSLNNTIIAYTNWVWSLYTEGYGSSDTVGFSVPCGTGCTNSLAMFPKVYGTSLPPVFELHIYGQSCSPSSPPADQTYLAAWNYLSQHGEGQGWIIGETCYNDASTAQLFQSAHQSAGNTVFYIQQWPALQNPTSVPLLYSNWIAYGW